MKHDLSDKWGERLLILQAQMKREPANMMILHWRGEARILRFLLGRYGQIEAPAPAESNAPGGVADDAATPPDNAVTAPGSLATSALERSLLRLALLIPNVASKRIRPQSEDRAAILERIRIARDEGRAIEDAEDAWWEEINAQARRRGLRLSEREAEWKRREQRERKEQERARRQ